MLRHFAAVARTSVALRGRALRSLLREGALVLVGVGCLSIAVVGCGRRMSQSDCERIGAHLRDVWDADVQATAPRSDEAKASELGQLVIKSHRERISNEWMNQCRRELEGRPVDDKEINCILEAKAIADVQACATQKP